MNERQSKEMQSRRPMPAGSAGMPGATAEATATAEPGFGRRSG